MRFREAKEYLVTLLSDQYDQRESQAIADLVLGQISGLRAIDRILEKTAELDPSQEKRLRKYGEELDAGRPVQYVLQEAWFARMRFYVDESVLIPRPETEELVEWMLDGIRRSSSEHPSGQAWNILDMGTGSGCIAIALKRSLPKATLWACDIRPEALQVAIRNGRELGASVEYIEWDMLSNEYPPEIPLLDFLVSNPPYIPSEEKAGLAKHVAAFEPGIALFVPGKDPLLFYRSILSFSQSKLKPGGILYLEIHPPLARTLEGLLEAAGFSGIESRKDMQGLERFVKAN